ncbi:MAG: hypothetical protein H7249_01495 [Chitinophagaceae bacterium]|nr:hypothetical protein [Oligoflexus sp.]
MEEATAQFTNQTRPKDPSSSLVVVTQSIQPDLNHSHSMRWLNVKTTANGRDSYAVIDIPSPEPGGIRFTISDSSQTNFTTNFGDGGTPLAAGDYYVKLEGKGIVYYGVIEVNSDPHKFGIDDNGNVTHAAVNINTDWQTIGVYGPIHVGQATVVPNLTFKEQNVTANGTCGFDFSAWDGAVIDNGTGLAYQVPGAPQSVHVKAYLLDPANNQTTAYTVEKDIVATNTPNPHESA